MIYLEALFEIEKVCIWKNKKTGNWYEVLGVAQHSED